MNKGYYCRHYGTRHAENGWLICDSCGCKVRRTFIGMLREKIEKL